MKEKAFLLTLVLGILILLFSCSTSQTTVKSEAQPTKTSVEKLPPYIIQPGDQLDIRFFYNPELNETVVVRPDGMISLQLLDEVKAAGLEPSQLDDVLTRMYSQELKKPVITVIVRSFTGQRVYVGGEVNRVGLITLQPGLTALQAVFQSGGFRETAQPAETLVIRKGQGGKPVPIRIDLAEVMAASDPNADFQLQADDIVYIPKSAIAKANKFVNQYIEQLFLFRGVSLGFSYELHSDSSNN
jgi:protein involved in polysaccharide export with SLBB domain